MENMISKYITYIRSRVLKYSKIIDSSIDDIVLLKYIDVYINTSFYHKLGTLDKANDFGHKTLLKELRGMYYEVTYEEVCDKEVARRALYIIDIISLIFHKRYKTIESLSIDINTINNEGGKLELDINSFINPLYKEINKTISTLTKFVSKLDNEDFWVNYTKLDDNSYYTKLECKLGLLYKFKNNAVDKAFLSSALNYHKTLTLIDLINTEFLKGLPYKKDYTRYFFDYHFTNDIEDAVLLENMTSNCFGYIVPVVDNKEYQTSKLKVRRLSEVVEVGLRVDFRHISDLKTKLDSLDELPNITYLFLDNVSSGDLNYLKGFESTYGKKVFIENVRED